jgi:metallophosphoesterase (TIGR03767 family)
MARISRREFLRLAGGASLAAPFLGLPGPAAAGPRGRGLLLTTLARTIERGRAIGEGTEGSYHVLRFADGEPHRRRFDLAPRARGRRSVRRTSLLHFAHYTDLQLVDAQSPARVEFLDRYADRECQSIPFEAAWRPQETVHAYAYDRAIRAVNRIGRSPVTGAPIGFAMCTGDNIDNEHFNELRWFIRLMDGGRIDLDSGGHGYGGVQRLDWNLPDYWHPDQQAEGEEDKYKRQWGFPEYPGLLDEAVTPFEAAGVRFPWYSCNGNHDTLMQGNAPQNPFFESVAVGGTKVVGPPPGNPCDQFDTLISNPSAVFSGTPRPTPADPRREIVTRQQYVREHFRTHGAPRGHGFILRNLRDGTAYYKLDRHPRFKLIVLDTTNPGGESQGSVGDRQLGWLEQRLINCHSEYFDGDGRRVRTGHRDRLVVIFSHHGLETLTNELQDPDPFNPEANDLPRHQAETVEALVHRFPNVILWVNGHTHQNRIVPRPDPEGRTHGFWDVTTAAVCDWPCQVRLVEVVDNGNGFLSIFCTVVDHDGAPRPAAEEGRTSRLASIHRELAANDPHGGLDGGAHGTRKDRNVELLIRTPFPLGAA